MARKVSKDFQESKEHDPHGKDAHTTGAKLDGGKLQPDLILGDMSRAITAVIDIATLGAQKYTPGGWLYVSDGYHRYTNALNRHLLAENAVGPIDPQWERLHAAHAAWNALARLELLLRGCPDGLPEDAPRDFRR